MTKPIIRPVRGFNTGDNFNPENPSGCDAGWTYSMEPQFSSGTWDATSQLLFTDPAVITQDLTGNTANGCYAWINSVPVSGLKVYMNWDLKVAGSVSVSAFICYSGIGIFSNVNTALGGPASIGNNEGAGAWALRTQSCFSGNFQFFLGRNNSGIFSMPCASGATGTLYRAQAWISVGAKVGAVWPVTTRYAVTGVFDTTRTYNVSFTSDVAWIGMQGYYQGNLDPANTLFKVNQLYMVAQTGFPGTCGGSSPFMHFRRDRSGATYKKKGHLWLLN